MTVGGYVPCQNRSCDDLSRCTRPYLPSFPQRERQNSIPSRFSYHHTSKYMSCTLQTCILGLALAGRKSPEVICCSSGSRSTYTMSYNAFCRWACDRKQGQHGQTKDKKGHRSYRLFCVAPTEDSSPRLYCALHETPSGRNIKRIGHVVCGITPS